MAKGFSVTFETVTQESAKHSDAAERGFLLEDATFRDAVETFNRERDWTMVEADEMPLQRPTWFTDIGETAFASGDCRSVSLHLPERVSRASRMRIARLVNCYGARR